LILTLNNLNLKRKMAHRDGLGSAAGKRLRTDGMKRTEEECRQMLRLAEVENKELKNSLRYVEI